MDTIIRDIAVGLFTLCVVVYTSLVLLSAYYEKQYNAESFVPGCRRLGLVGRSNMSDQYSRDHSGENTKQETCKIKALFIYPVKSCGSVEIEDAEVVLTGLRYDRQFCFAQLKSEEAEKGEGDLGVNARWVHNWKFITQRSVPRLSQISTQVWLPDASVPGYSPNAEWVKTKGCVVCSFAFTPEWDYTLEGLKTALTIVRAKLAQRSIKAEPRVTFKLPIAPDTQRSRNYTSETIKIWKDSPTGFNITSEIPPDTLAKLKYFLGVSNPLALFQADPLKHREVFRNAPRKEEAGYQPGVGFADAYPLHLMGIPSVQRVSSTMTTRPTPTLDALRFRANIYTTGAPPFAEDDWRKIRSGNLSYHVSCRTTRCDLPNVDQATGIKDRHEPFLHLKKTRGDVDPGASPHPCLGMQMVPLLKDAQGSEAVRVGEEIEILETGDHYYIKMFQ